MILDLRPSSVVLQLNKWWRNNSHCAQCTTVLCYVYVLPRLKGKWAVSLSIDRYSFHPTVFSKKAENRIGGAAVSGAGVRPDLLRGHESPIQSVIKHTAQPADHTPPSGLSPGCCRPPLPGIKHRAAASPALGYQPGCLITKTHRAKQ